MSRHYHNCDHQLIHRFHKSCFGTDISSKNQYFAIIIQKSSDKCIQIINVNQYQLPNLPCYFYKNIVPHLEAIKEKYFQKIEQRHKKYFKHTICEELMAVVHNPDTERGKWIYLDTVNT